MNRRFAILSVFTAGIFLCGCSGSQDNLAFTGTWNIVKANDISGDATTSIVNVTVSGNRYRISSRDEETETVEFYDGHVLHRQSLPLHPANSTEAAPTPTITTEPKSDVEVGSRRFWKRDFSGPATAGGQIAGRETLLYQTQEKMLDGEMTMQAWVDADTKVILKKIFTIYSAQIQQTVSKTREECAEIKYGPVDESAFSRF